ncbi:MAG TPA: PQQ-dependent sugar dehydrogenase [Vicinamibacterales bacterium]|nr:PQQ-dependent sugar dehydrogenase [Vicinamibacterales bacterium]
MPIASLVLAAAVAACAEQPGAADRVSTPDGPPGQTASGCQPLETRPANAPDQRPAFPGQTRACGVTSNVAFEVVVLAKGLDEPWAVEPLPDGSLLVTEKPGRMRIVSAAGALGEPIAGVPKVDDRNQGGLLDVALSPAFDSDRTIYWSFSEPREKGNATSVARGVLSADRQRLDQVKVIFQAMPPFEGTMHYGSRLAFGPDGMLYVTLGERSDRSIRPQAQQLDSHMGKILRLRPDGSAPPDNPFVGQQGARPEIWTVGHRNVQSAAFDSRGQLWIVEHGPRGGDELNLLEKGKNYGWPLVSYGLEYSGQPIPNAVTSREGYEDPVYYWDPVIAPSGAEFYSGDAFPAWRGSLFIGALRDQRLVRLTLENNRVTGEEHLLTDRNQRVRDVRQGPDGALYVVTDERNGELWKIAPR